jgi:hypothetical protein
MAHRDRTFGKVGSQHLTQPVELAPRAIKGGHIEHDARTVTQPESHIET